MRTEGKPQTFSNLAMGMVLFLFLAAPVTAQIPCSYDVQIIASSNDCGGLGTVNTFGLGLNERGDVVGYYRCPLWDHTEAFPWTADGGFVTLQRPQGVSSAIAVDINDEGIICGTVFVSGLDNRGFVYENGKWTILPPVVDVPGARCSAAAINNAGTVAGQRSLTEELNPQNAYIWSAAEGFRDLEGLEELSAAAAITGKIITGWTANAGEMKEGYLWDDGEVTILGPIPGGLSSNPAAVTNQSVIVGSGAIRMDGYQFGVPRAFLWQGGRFTMLGTLPNHLTSSSRDINDEGIVVGNSSNVDGNPNIFHAFISTEGSMNDLNDFIDPDLGLVLRSAPGIGKSGQIVANGKDDAGETLSFFLTPRNSPLGDLDGDCIVGVADLLILLAEWGQRDSPADLNGDGIVGVKDLLILLGNWG